MGWNEKESNYIFWNVKFHHLYNFNVSFVWIDLGIILSSDSAPGVVDKNDQCFIFSLV